ncbi:mitochondrial import inner membrane translocase subunit Tim13-like [Apis laboriosa]|uniref:Mitochondrial import inner membrane translocase subunit n=2 Tax=Apis TaxID=7459 RepID=A0A7M7FZM2_APIME|nr:mitochondrial import inner membrane translocase subunit Tim13 [Apis mellifera]XP_003696522.1 mitochondrial import inner membrane translocase subunit Tim13-like [Apis florea]XP_006621286.1 mitochondrial import inner membrane translocase subunit Tim13-like [Apis dorsata]XP_016920956.1 mitochondrial import inner membrane translocase subunit Tim13-like [Apis cerana]XP_043792952.1 mitochondrial import inner membrane translocase subunit Tim13-like [Apis laboriosa]KAG6800627.1 mitochondrial import|eukprot:XP_001121522.1 mitochondrial import inner membrane translocase subunit Tim13 [Apis mellifera]
MSALTSESLTDKEKSEFMQQIKQEFAIASAQEMLSKMSEKCFKKCVVRPGTSLDSSEQKCVAMCMDRYMDAFNLVSKTYSARIQREHNRM